MDGDGSLRKPMGGAGVAGRADDPVIVTEYAGECEPDLAVGSGDQNGLHGGSAVSA